MSKLRGWNSEYSELVPTTSWECHVAGIQINNTKFVAIAHAPTRTKVTSNQSSTLFIPIHGRSNKAEINRSSVVWNTGEHAAYAPEGERIANGGSRSVLMVDIDQKKILNTMAIMSGTDLAFDKEFDFSSPAAVALRVGRISFDTIIHSLCSTIDSLSKDQHLLNHSGIDDTFYRVFCMMFKPKLFLGETERFLYDSRIRRNLDKACQYAMAHLDQPISLTDLEKVASLSRRALQYAFRKKFGCTPMQWIRLERINAAHKRILNAQPGDSISQIAIASGFNSLSNFSRYYRQQFGVLPSEMRSRL